MTGGGPDVADWENGRTRLCSQQCRTCIFRSGNQMGLAPGRLRQLVDEARQPGTGYIVCHETLPGIAPAGFRPAICRGFADQYDTWQLRLIRALWGFTEVPPPPENSLRNHSPAKHPSGDIAADKLPIPGMMRVQSYQAGVDAGYLLITMRVMERRKCARPGTDWRPRLEHRYAYSGCCAAGV